MTKPGPNTSPEAIVVRDFPPNPLAVIRRRAKRDGAPSSNAGSCKYALIQVARLWAAEDDLPPAQPGADPQRPHAG